MRSYFKTMLGLVLFTLTTLTAGAQEKGFTWGAFGASGRLGHDSSAVRLESYAGYNFNPGFALLLQAENDFLLMKEDETDKNHVFQTIGAAVKYNVYAFKSGIVDLKAGVGTGLFTKDWNCMYYDFGVYLQASREQTKPTIGLGIRKYRVTKGEKIDNPCVYVSVGFTVN